MIISFLLNIVFFFSSKILSLFPTGSLPDDLIVAALSVNAYLAAFAQILPLTTLFSVLGVVLGVETLIGLYKLIKWSYNKIPGVN
jgi:hypothetical protein